MVLEGMGMGHKMIVVDHIDHNQTPDDCHVHVFIYKILHLLTCAFA